MSELSESVLAWDVFDAVRPGLPAAEVTGIAVQLSSDDAITTIARLVQYCVHAGHGLTADIVHRLYRWQQGYAGHHAEERLGMLLSQLVTEPIREPTQPSRRLAIDPLYATDRPRSP
jgi:hypothetical protein